MLFLLRTQELFRVQEVQVLQERMLAVIVDGVYVPLERPILTKFVNQVMVMDLYMQFLIVLLGPALEPSLILSQGAAASLHVRAEASDVLVGRVPATQARPSSVGRIISTRHVVRLAERGELGFFGLRSLISEPRADPGPRRVDRIARRLHHLGAPVGLGDLGFVQLLGARVVMVAVALGRSAPENVNLFVHSIEFFFVPRVLWIAL
jgi:hypothetical protein